MKRSTARILTTHVGSLPDLPNLVPGQANYDSQLKVGGRNADPQAAGGRAGQHQRRRVDQRWRLAGLSRKPHRWVRAASGWSTGRDLRVKIAKSSPTTMRSRPSGAPLLPYRRPAPRADAASTWPVRSRSPTSAAKRSRARSASSKPRWRRPAPRGAVSDHDRPGQHRAVSAQRVLSDRGSIPVRDGRRARGGIPRHRGRRFPRAGRRRLDRRAVGSHRHRDGPRGVPASAARCAWRC